MPQPHTLPRTVVQPFKSITNMSRVVCHEPSPVSTISKKGSVATRKRLSVQHYAATCADQTSD